MSEIDVRCEPGGGGWICQVTVSESGSHTEHEVSVGREELARLAPATDDPQALVETSFAYLLEREPKESILRSFAISEIERYFPDYPRQMAARL